jgi:uncharacterized SAM-binding protein YcdF (DUF218 family)
VYSIVTELLQPIVVFSAATLLGLANLWYKRRESRRRLLLVTVPVAVLILGSLPAVSYLALGSLENFAPPLQRLPDDAQAIVVLGGYAESVSDAGMEFAPGHDTLCRCVRALELYRQGDGRTVLVSGGKAQLDDPQPAVAEVMRDYLAGRGVASNDLVVEAESRSTYENAVQCRRLLEQRGIHKVVLVTEAAHLRRAVGCFRRQGLEVVPCGAATGRSGTRGN